MSKAFDALIVVAIVAVVIGTVGTFVGFGEPRQTSTYTGYVVDVEYERGLVFPTTQVHMKTHPRSSAVETFCIPPDGYDDGRLDALRTAQANQSRLTVTYERPFFVWRGTCKPGLSIARSVTNSTGGS